MNHSRAAILLAFLSHLFWAHLFSANIGHAQVRDDGKAVAPANHVSLKHVATGVIYVDKDLMGKYHAAKERYDSLRRERYRSAGSLTIDDEAFAQAEKEFLDLKSEIDTAGVLVEPFDVYQRRETQSFDLGESSQIAITADDVTIRGWDGKNIKCVIEKAVLGTKEPDAAEFEAIRVDHAIRQADDWVGITDEKRKEQEDKFLAADKGKKLDPSGAEFRKNLLQSIRDHYIIYGPMQGKPINTLSVVGLTGQEGNVHLTGEIRSPGGGKSMGGYWRRSAKVTIYVPACKDIAVRGCMVAVDIKSIQANLILTTDGSHDRSYGSDFKVSDVTGNMSIRQAPIRHIHGVTGNIDFLQTDEVTNTSTSHSGGTRVTSSPPPAPTQISNVGGDLKGQFVRADLNLKDIGGQIDVFNEYGNTQLSITKDMNDMSHRIVSHSGVIRLTCKPVPKEYPDTQVHDLVGIPLHAFTQTGAVKIRGLRKRLDDKSYSSEGRGWRGFQSPTDGFSFTALGRPGAAWQNAERESGLDLISCGGTVVVESKQD